MLGLTPLLLAVKRDYADIVETLIVHGSANLDVADGKSGQTPLYTAADLNRLAVAELLLLHGANPQIPNYSGLTPSQVNISLYVVSFRPNAFIWL